MQKSYSRIVIIFLTYTIILGTLSLKAFSCDDSEKIKVKTSKVVDVPIDQEPFLSGILAGYNFDEGNPDIFVDNINDSSTLRTRIGILDKEFEVIPIKQKYCLGSYNLELMKGIPCPVKSFVENRSQNCEACNERTGFNPAFYKVDRLTLSSQQQLYNLKSHYVYLAYFNNELPKVGIAYKPRLLGRWLEQGALVATILQECNSAYEARELEEMVSKTFKLPEGYSSEEKLNFLKRPFNLESAHTTLREYKNKIVSHLQLKTSKHDIYDLRSHYYKSSINFNELRDVSQESSPFRGRCVGMIGDKIIYRDKLDLKKQFIKRYVGKAIIKVFIK